MRFGAAKGRRDLVIVTTLGTGIGSAIVYDGVLVPNSELGHLEIDGHDAEKRAASSIKENEGLSYAEWAKRLTVYYRTLEKLFSPDLIVVGGGVSKDSAEFLHLIEIETEIVAAKLQNRAGIVGAALWAAEAGDEREESREERTLARLVPGRASLVDRGTRSRRARRDPVSDGQTSTA